MKTMSSLLSERQSSILAATVKEYIHTAQPVASNRVRQVYHFHLSAATIRNTMATLERLGYLSHPYTSAGKVPTDQGYRTYVNQLMVIKDLDGQITSRIRQNLDQLSGDADKLLRIVAHIISQLTGGLGITIAPMNLRSRLSAIRLVPVSHRRMLFVMELDSGSVRTVVAEGKRSVPESQLATLEEILNERLRGLTLEAIEATIGQRLEGTIASDLGIAALILRHSTELFNDSEQGAIYIYGLQQVVRSPEFCDQSNIVTLMDLVENEERMRELICGEDNQAATSVTIGHEHQDEQLETFATISRNYCHGNSSGTLAVLAPKRVNYPRVFAILEFMDKTISELI
ncbi:MAG: heat-inducible transcription repressor HrcA [Fidelibacterota bacterium]|nr:MAG: heat-inducible transcription repressor HrcA [Candidatus Neomarinimicrobiota bacterium]